MVGARFAAAHRVRRQFARVAAPTRMGLRVDARWRRNCAIGADWPDFGESGAGCRRRLHGERRRSPRAIRNGWREASTSSRRTRSPHRRTTRSQTEILGAQARTRRTPARFDHRRRAIAAAGDTRRTAPRGRSHRAFRSGAVGHVVVCARQRAGGHVAVAGDRRSGGARLRGAGPGVRSVGHRRGAQTRDPAARGGRRHRTGRHRTRAAARRRGADRGSTRRSPSTKPGARVRRSRRRGTKNGFIARVSKTAARASRRSASRSIIRWRDWRRAKTRSCCTASCIAPRR